MSMPQLGNTREFEATGSEWKKDDGTMLYKLLVLTKVENNEFVAWDVRAGDVYSLNNGFNNARDSYICAYVKKLSILTGKFRKTTSSLDR